MRAVLALVLLGACGFSVPGSAGGNGPGSDGGAAHDAPADGSTATSADAASDAPIDAAPQMTVDAAGCPADYLAVPNAGTGHRYKAHGELDQGTALATCAIEGTHLLRLDTQAEADALVDFITNSLTSSNDDQYRVIGARDRLSQPNAWRDGLTALSFLPWAPSEPRDGLFIDCMLLESHANAGALVAADCGTPHEFACECE